MTEHTTTLPDGRRLLATHQGHNTVGWVVHIAGAEGRRFRLLGGLSSHAITRCAPVPPHSSFQFRHFMAALGDRWRLIAPDLPGFGYSATPDPERFSYTFAGYGRSWAGSRMRSN